MPDTTETAAARRAFFTSRTSSFREPFATSSQRSSVAGVATFTISRALV